MAIVFASNDITDFPGATAITTAGRFRSAYVSEAFQVSDGSSGSRTQESYVRFPEVSGDITWIHFQYWKNTNIGGTNAEGNTLFIAYASDGGVVFYFDVIDGAIYLNINGTNGAGFGDLLSKSLHALDFKVDTSGSTVVVDMYINGIFILTRSVTSSVGNPVGLHFRGHDHENSGIQVLETVSEFIVAEEDTRGLGLAVMTPNGVGNHTAWIGNHVETGDDLTGSGASADATGLKLSSTLSSYAGPATPAMLALVINNRASTRGGTVGDLRNFVRISSTDYNAAAMGAGESIEPHISVFDTNPDTTDPWDSADFASLEVGIESLA